MDDSDKINLNISPLTAQYMPRPRLYKIFDQASARRLVYVIAGVGYGKTQTVRRYIEQDPNAVVRWSQLTERDNAGSHYWQNLIHNISSDNPELAEKLREFGFPESLSRFKHFIEILTSTEYRSHKTFFVFDDFYWIHSEQMLTFARRCVYTQIPGLCTVIISRKEPQINAVPLFSKGDASIVTEDELRFTENEITDFLKLQDLYFSPKDISKITDATKGWAFAVNMLALILKKTKKNLDAALGVMKQNVFKLLESEAWAGFPESVRKTMARISLISEPPLVPLREITGDEKFLQTTPELMSFVWFDSIIDSYRIHPLYLEFLHDRQKDILSDAEKCVIYGDAARWCSENGFYMDAMNYYAKSAQYERMVEFFLSHPFQLPHEACETFIELLEKLDPNGEKSANIHLLILKNSFIPILLAGAGRYEEAQERSFAIIRQWENSKEPIAAVLLHTSYSNLAYIDMFLCTAAHEYKAPEYLKKMLEYLKHSSIAPKKPGGSFSSGSIRSFACTVGEGASLFEFDQFLQSVRESALYIAQTPDGRYSGYEDLAASEIAFFKNQLETAKNYAHSSILKARDKNQHSIEAMAWQYLLRAAVFDGDCQLVKKILKQLRALSDNPDFWYRRMLYDLFAGQFYIQIGLPELIPSWFTANEKETDFAIHIPGKELGVKVKYYIATKKYDRALAALNDFYPLKPHERFLFGKLATSLLTAAARCGLGDTAGAAADFEKAYELSFCGVFEMFFIELGKELHPIVTAALNQPDCKIPKEWLKAINRKASIYAKKAAVVKISVENEEHIKETVRLSEREKTVLTDLYHGLSREDVAANRYISINTVNKSLHSVFIKLNANSIIDAIRIALENKLIE